MNLTLFGNDERVDVPCLFIKYCSIFEFLLRENCYDVNINNLHILRHDTQKNKSNSVILNGGNVFQYVNVSFFHPRIVYKIA